MLQVLESDSDEDFQIKPSTSKGTNGGSRPKTWEQPVDGPSEVKGNLISVLLQ